MSAGTFTTSKYEDANGRIYSIRVQPETLGLTLNSVVNDAPAGNVDQPVFARARGSRRAYGVTARKVTIRFTGTPPTGYSGDDVSVPVLQQSVFNGYSVGQTGTYLAAPCEFLSKTGEQIR